MLTANLGITSWIIMYNFPELVLQEKATLQYSYLLYKKMPITNSQKWIYYIHSFHLQIWERCRVRELWRSSPRFRCILKYIGTGGNVLTALPGRKPVPRKTSFKKWRSIAFDFFSSYFFQTQTLLWLCLRCLSQDQNTSFSANYNPMYYREYSFWFTPREY